jgi:hypothetical protein
MPKSNAASPADGNGNLDGDRRQLPMAAVNGYFDASGEKDSTQVLAVGGVLAPAEKWISFEGKWSEHLKAFDVPALHMKTFAHSVKEFSHMRDDQPKRRRFLNGLLWILEEHLEFSAACAIHIPDYRRIDAKYQLSERYKPYTLACLTCASAILRHIDDDAPGYRREDIVYFFEKGDTDQNELREEWKHSIGSLRVEPIFLEKCDSYPSGSPRKRIRQFEAGDLIAYENLKANNKIIESEGGDVFFDELRKPMQRMKGLPGAEGWLFCNYANLEDICQRWQIPLR